MGQTGTMAETGTKWYRLAQWEKLVLADLTNYGWIGLDDELICNLECFVFYINIGWSLAIANIDGG